MAVYVATYTNDIGQIVDVNIEDITTPEETTINLADKPIKVQYNVEDENDPFSPIMTSTCELRVIMGLDAASISFFEDMSSAKDGQWTLSVTVHDGAGTSFGHFVGLIVPDGMDRGISYRNDIITVRAVDIIEQAKSRTLRKADGTQFVGRYKIKDYLEAILGSVAIINSIVESSIVLTNTPENPLPTTPITEQLWLDASVFNDSNGRPINAYESLKIIAYGLGVRASVGYVVGVPTLMMYEILSYPNKMPGAVDIGLHEEGSTDNFLLGNREVLSRQKTFKEIKGSFSYEGADGIVENGAMQFYDANGKPSGVDISPSLAGLPDLTVRQRGNGRVENPFGFVLKSTYAEPGSSIVSRRIDTIDMLTFKTPSAVVLPAWTTINIDITARLEDVGYVAESDGQEYTAMIVDAIIYNTADPANSIRSVLDGDGLPNWQTIDLSGNALFASGQYDFSVNNRNEGWFAVIPSGSIGPFGPIFGASKYISQFGTPIEFSAKKDVSQTGSIELPKITVGGRLFIAISQILDAGPMLGHATLAEVNASTEMDTRIENVLVSAEGLREGKTETVYITRAGDHTTDNKDFEIDINATYTPTAKGALWTDVTYRDDNQKVGRFYRGPGWLRGIQSTQLGPFSEREQNYMSLVKYGALARMSLNKEQNKMDFSVRSSSLPPQFLITFTTLTNISMPSTLLYMFHHIQQAQTWDVTSGERDVTAISLTFDKREIQEHVEPNETTDLIEIYYQ